MDPAPPAVTPKRKREETVAYTPLRFSFDVSATNNLEERSSSPQSKVAHKFLGLMLEGEGRSGTSGDDIIGTSSLKRVRTDDTMAPDNFMRGVTAANNEIATALADIPIQGRESAGVGNLQKSYPSINRLSESKSRGRRRAGTPPLRLRKGPVRNVADDADEDDEDEEMEIVEPIRAALTWHEHEITVYDPEDEEDDGTGINGIGFKPTPAEAHARTAKRKQQMAEYKKREDGEARARRNERRRQDAAAAAALESGEIEEDSQARKVRFHMEGDRNITTANNATITT